MNTPEPEVMTLAEAADYLRCHPSTIYRMLKRGEIPAMKLGSDWRFTRATLAEWVRARTVAVSARVQTSAERAAR